MAQQNYRQLKKQREEARKIRQSAKQERRQSRANAPTSAAVVEKDQARVLEP